MFTSIPGLYHYTPSGKPLHIPTHPIPSFSAFICDNQKRCVDIAKCPCRMGQNCPSWESMLCGKAAAMGRRLVWIMEDENLRKAEKSLGRWGLPDWPSYIILECPGLAENPAGRSHQLATCVWPEDGLKFCLLHTVIQLFQLYLFKRLFPFLFLWAGIHTWMWTVCFCAPYTIPLVHLSIPVRITHVLSDYVCCKA